MDFCPKVGLSYSKKIRKRESSNGKNKYNGKNINRMSIGTHMFPPKCSF